MKRQSKRDLIDELIGDLFKEVDAQMEDEPIQKKCSIVAKVTESGRGSVEVEGIGKNLIKLAYQIIDGLSLGMEIPFSDLMLEILLIEMESGKNE